MPVKKINPIVIGIIGGKGGMGKLFHQLWQSQGHKVLVASRRTSLTPIECAKKSDLVVITVPINATKQVIQAVAPHVKKDGAIMDFTSLKGFPTEIMAAKAQCEVLGCHPIFGPSLDSLENQVIVLCPVRGKKWLHFCNQSFLSAKAKVKILSAEEHDKLMAVVQGLIHFTSITLAGTMERLGLDQKTLNDISSPVYRFRMDFANRILNQDAGLYADIEMMNDYFPEILKSYEEQTKELAKIVRQKNRSRFIRVFNKISEHLGLEKKKAQKRTDKLIQFASKLK